MIITAPTGLYEPILPQNPMDVGNFTFTISNRPPPRSIETFVQLPLPEIVKKQPERIFSKLDKREFLGKLIFDVVIPGPAITGNGASQFEIGEILEFSDSDIESGDPFTLQKEELRQDLKVIDFESAGLSQDDFNELRTASEQRMSEITTEMSSISSDLNSNKESIHFNQAKINSSNSILRNIVIVLGENSQQANKVKNKLEDLNFKRDELLTERNILQNSLQQLREELQKVREVVR